MLGSSSYLWHTLLLYASDLIKHTASKRDLHIPAIAVENKNEKKKYRMLELLDFL
ncbi:hypothetical protein ACJX0J_035096, partial [Zea mays]